MKSWQQLFQNESEKDIKKGAIGQETNKTKKLTAVFQKPRFSRQRLFTRKQQKFQVQVKELSLISQSNPVNWCYLHVFVYCTTVFIVMHEDTVISVCTRIIVTAYQSFSTGIPFS